MERVHQINRKYLLKPKILYFFMNLQFYTLYQFKGNFITEFFGISKATYGTMMGFILFITFVTNIFMATVNDKFARPRLFLISTLIFSTIFFQLFYVSAFIDAFVGMFWINLLLYHIFNTSIPPIMDKITLEYLAHNTEAGIRTYGKQRLWGTLGYLVSNYLVELSIRPKSGPQDKYNFEGLRSYQLTTAIISGTLVLLLVKGSGINRPSAQNGILKSWKQLLMNSKYMFFILIILMNGVTRAAMTLYLSIYLKEIVKLKGYSIPDNWPSFLVSIINIFNGSPLATTSLFGTMFEVIILYHSERITQKFGLYWPLLAAQFFQLIRFGCYFLIPLKSSNILFFICMFELLKGLNFGLTHASAVQIATQLCPPHLKTTSQMIYSGTFTGLASVFTGLIFGSLFNSRLKDESLSASSKNEVFKTFFLMNCGITAISILLFIVRYGIFEGTLSMSPQESTQVLEPKKQKQPQSEVAADATGDMNDE